MMEANRRFCIKLMFALIVFLNSYLVFASIHSKLDIQSHLYGKSKEGRDLVALELGIKNISPKSYIVLVEGVHGNEYMGILKRIIKRSIKELHLIKRYLNMGGKILFFPKFNPDGVRVRSRNNSSNLDLNRKFGSKLAESSEISSFVDFLRNKLLKNEANLLFGLDYHCCAGKILVEESTIDAKTIKKIQTLVNKSFKDKYEVSNSYKVFGTDFKGTLKKFLAKEFNSLSMTYEAKKSILVVKNPMKIGSF